MKIKEFADGKGLTKQAVYKAINRAGFSAKQLTDNRGNLTKKGSQILNRLFPSGEQPEQDRTAEPDELQQELEILRDQIRELEKRCKEWESRYFAEVDSHKTETAQLRVLISQEQQLRLAAERKGFFRRLFAGKQKDEE